MEIRTYVYGQPSSHMYSGENMEIGKDCWKLSDSGLFIRRATGSIVIAALNDDMEIGILANFSYITDREASENSNKKNFDKVVGLIDYLRTPNDKPAQVWLGCENSSAENEDEIRDRKYTFTQLRTSLEREDRPYANFMTVDWSFQGKLMDVILEPEMGDLIIRRYPASSPGGC